MCGKDCLYFLIKTLPRYTLPRFLTSSLLCSLLVSCGVFSGGSKIRIEETVSMAHGDITVTVTRSAEVKSGSATTNPPEAKLPPMKIEPSLLIPGLATIESDNDHSIIPILAFSIATTGINAIGAWQSIQEAALDLLKWPIIIGGVIFAAGIVILIWLPIKKIGLAIMIAGASLAILSYLLASYSHYIAIGGILLLIGGIAYVIIDYRRRSNANKELVQTVQEIKTDKTVFKHSGGTKQVVAEAKKDLGYK